MAKKSTLNDLINYSKSAPMFYIPDSWNPEKKYLAFFTDKVCNEDTRLYVLYSSSNVMVYDEAMSLSSKIDKSLTYEDAANYFNGKFFNKNNKCVFKDETRTAMFDLISLLPKGKLEADTENLSEEVLATSIDDGSKKKVYKVRKNFAIVYVKHEGKMKYIPCAQLNGALCKQAIIDGEVVDGIDFGEILWAASITFKDYDKIKEIHRHA